MIDNFPSTIIMSKRICGLIVLFALLQPQFAATQDSFTAPSPQYTLSARPWQPANANRQQILATLESLCRFSIRHQDPNGAIIDPFLHREVQYATPYFAYAVGTLVAAGRAPDLLPHGIAAMDHSTLQFAQGRASIPDQHAEFFIAALTESLDVYQHLVPPSQLNLWRSRLRAPISTLTGPNRNNWMTYSMKGEWLRYRHGLVPRDEAVQFIETSWNTEQKDRILPTKFHLYQDRSSDPDTLSVETVGRSNLLALIEDGYDGPSAAAIRSAVTDGTFTSLCLQDPSGQLPANGRTDDHVWPDVGQGLAFQIMANRESLAGHAASAMAFQRGALLALQNIQRWRRNDGLWAGSFSITKNHFDPALRVGYQTASHYSNYTGSLMFHLAETFNVKNLHIPQRPTPSEIGGYVIALDPSYDSVFADAGGMQVQINLRGQTTISSGNYWTPLGIVRFARAAWDTRLGPSDGALTAQGGVTFAPEFFENGAWHRLADLSRSYRAEWRPEFVHPALVRGTIVLASPPRLHRSNVSNPIVDHPRRRLCRDRQNQRSSRSVGRHLAASRQRRPSAHHFHRPVRSQHQLHKQRRSGKFFVRRSKGNHRNHRSHHALHLRRSAPTPRRLQQPRQPHLHLPA